MKLQIQRFVVPAIFIPGSVRLLGFVFLVGPFLLVLEIKISLGHRHDSEAKENEPRRIYEIADLEVRHTSDLHTRAFEVPVFRIAWYEVWGFAGRPT